MQFSKVGQKIRVRTIYGEYVVGKLRENNFTWNSTDKVWENDYTEALWEWLEGLRQEKLKFTAQMDDRRKSELILMHPYSYECKESIKELGGVWDKVNKGWLMPSEGALWAAKKLCDEYAAKKARN